MTPYRAICPICNTRYGDAAPDGYIDVVTCPACAEKGLKNVDYCQRKEAWRKYQKKPDGWVDRRRKEPWTM